MSERRTRKIITVLKEREFFKSEKDRIIRKILSLLEMETNYRSLSLEKKTKIRNIILDEINDFYRLMVKNNDQVDG